MTNDQTTALESRITRIESILEIQNLQAKYGYYLQRGSASDWDELKELYTDDCELEVMDSGVHIGKKGFNKLIRDAKLKAHMPGLMGVILQIQPYIEVNGDTAKAVWNSFGMLTHGQKNGKKVALWNLGRYENEYRRVDGTWKISKEHLKLIFQTPFNAENGWVSHPVVNSVKQELTGFGVNMADFYDRPSTEFRPYNPLAKTAEGSMSDPVLPPPAKKQKRVSR